MYRRIAVPLDGTTASHQAIPWAVSIAGKARCPIDLVHVAFQPILGAETYGAAPLQPADIDEMRRIAHRSLRALADQIRSSTGIAATAIVLTGDLPDALTDHLQASDTDLVVMTTHDAGRIAQLLLGSVAQSVVRHVHIPVLLVLQDDSAPSFDAPRTIEKMLIPLDGSPFGDGIIPHAATLASLLSSEITLLGVLYPILAAATMATDLGGPNEVAIPLGVREDHPDLEQTDAETAVLERRAASLRASGLTVHTTVLVDGQTARAIVEYAKDQAMDAIAMTTHGRGALKRLIAGSVSRHVLRTSHLPMLMYRPGEN